MIEEAQDFIPIWMLLSAAFGFIVGEAYGDQARHRKCLEQVNADLRDQLQTIHTCPPPMQSAPISSAESSTIYTSASWL